MHLKISAISGSHISEKLQNKLGTLCHQPSAGCQFVFSIRVIVGVGADGQ
jgi:hypothetical protein